MPVKSAVVTKNEFIEVGVHVLAAQSVVRAKAPSLQQRNRSVVQTFVDECHEAYYAAAANIKSSGDRDLARIMRGRLADVA